jgi:hypothetical protein
MRICVVAGLLLVTGVTSAGGNPWAAQIVDKTVAPTDLHVRLTYNYLDLGRNMASIGLSNNAPIAKANERLGS